MVIDEAVTPTSGVALGSPGPHGLSSVPKPVPVAVASVASGLPCASALSRPLPLHELELREATAA